MGRWATGSAADRVYTVAAPMSGASATRSAGRKTDAHPRKRRLAGRIRLRQLSHLLCTESSIWVSSLKASNSVSKVERDMKHRYTEPVDAVSRRTFLRLLPVGFLLGKITTALPADVFAGGSPQDGQAASTDGSFFGLYRAGQNRYLGIDRFMADTGESIYGGFAG